MIFWTVVWLLVACVVAGIYVVMREAVERPKLMRERKALLDELANPTPPAIVPIVPIVSPRAVGVWVGPGIINAGPDAFIEHERERGHLS